MTYTYTSRNWLEELSNRKSDETVLSSFAYQHDDCGNRTQMTEATGDVTTYAYDALYELTGQTKRNSGDVVQYSYSYTYDDIGNRLTLTDQGSAVTTKDDPVFGLSPQVSWSGSWQLA